MFKFLKLLLIACLLHTTLVFANLAAPVGEKIDYVFIQNSHSAVLRPVANQSGAYLLTLKDVSPYITYFSERPYRMSGMMQTEKFLEVWKKGHDSFAEDAPNVSVSGVNVHGIFNRKTMTYTLALSNPQYNAKKHEMTYDAKILQNSNIALTKAIKLQNVVIFLDSGWCPGCCCG